MSQKYEHCSNFLRGMFGYLLYDKVVDEIRKNCANSEVSREEWGKFKEIIMNRALMDSEPLRLLHEGANQVLDYNTDEEAYKWLDLLIENVERADGEITAY